MPLMPLLKKIESQDDKHRRRAIIDEITRYGLTPIIDGYSFKGFKGDNIMVTLPGKIRKKIILAAHSDAFPGSFGANDDASGCTILLDVLRRLKGKPLKYAVKFIFFDQEEVLYAGGAIGSQAYVRKFEIDNVIAVLNPELVGMGDSIATWTVDKKTRNGLALAAMRQACNSLGIHLEEVGHFPEIDSDYQTFREEGHNNALAFAVFPYQDLDLLRQYVKHPVWSYRKYKLGLLGFPRLFKHYHNEMDRSEFLSEKALQMSAEMLYRAVEFLGKV